MGSLSTVSSLLFSFTLPCLGSSSPASSRALRAGAAWVPEDSLSPFSASSPRAHEEAVLSSRPGTHFSGPPAAEALGFRIACLPDPAAPSVPRAAPQGSAMAQLCVLP